MNHPRRRPAQISRRHLFGGAFGVAAAAMGVPLLSSCGDGGNGGPGGPASPTGYAIPSVGKPLAQPLHDDNPPIRSGLSPEKATVLKVLNYAEYMAPEVMEGFRKKFGAQVQVTPYGDFEELQRRLIAPGAEYDVVFAGPTIMSRLVDARLIRPLNHDYLPNLVNLWPEFQDPWYDKGAGYSVPYNVYSHGIGYRKDRVEEVPENGYLMLWDPRYKGKIGVFDDAIDALSMVLLAWGITEDISTSDPAHINAARDKLIELLPLGVKTSIAQYELIPSGKVTVHQAWSGDMTFAESYLTGDTTIEDIGYWIPDDPSKRIVSNETISVGRSGRNPVLAHEFVNHVIDEKVAETNAGWTGYQPPLRKLTKDYMVANELVPANLSSAVLDAGSFEVGLQFTELSIPVRALWLKAWQQFLGGRSS
jgi:spermidine/putrescine transport system substrate-binding protein